jgi:hypothetical protein
LYIASATINPEAAYGLLRFSELNLAGGEWRNLLIRMSMDSVAHATMHGVLLHQLETFTSTARSDNEDSDIIPWFEPTYNTPTPFGQLNLPVNERTIANIATLIKSIWHPKLTILSSSDFSQCPSTLRT